jgi:hypothetical protein
MSSDNFEPVWTVKSDEVAMGFMIVAFILAFPAIPAGVLGWWLGVNVIGNNFAKWGLMIFLFTVTYLFIIYLKNKKGIQYAALFVFLEYLVFDFTLMKMHNKETLVMVDLVKSFINWGLSLS